MTPNPQALGKAHEAWVESQHREALRLGLLAFEPEHNEPQVQRVRGRLVRVKRSVSDWTGMLSAARGSRLFAAEAKATVGERIPKSAVRPHQARYLTKVAAGGGLAALVVAFRAADDIPRCCAIPWGEVPWSTGRWKLGLRVEDALPWEVLEGECYVGNLLRGEWAAQLSVGSVVAVHDRATGERAAEPVLLVGAGKHTLLTEHGQFLDRRTGNFEGGVFFAGWTR